MGDAQKNKTRLQECLDYFRKRPAFRKLFEGMREKYASLGYLGGTVILDSLTQEEKRVLGGFFRKDYQGKKRVSISAKQFCSCLAESRFAGIPPESILEAYFGEPLIAKKEERQRDERQRETFFRELIAAYKGTIGGKWLEAVLKERKKGYYIFRRKYRDDPEKLRDITRRVMNGINSLSLPAIGRHLSTTFGEIDLEEDKNKKSKRNMRSLAVFAAEASGNPHSFDSGTTEEKLLFAFLSDYFSRSDDPEEPALLSETEQKNRLLFQAGILKDDLSNMTLAYGIRGWKNDGELHRGLEGYFQENEPAQITLRTLGNLCYANAQQEDVYVLENPAVFSAVIEKYPACAAVCACGQPGLATLILLDLLKENHTFHYAGDFDPEGLLIAQNLKERYGSKLTLWNYQVEWYEKYLSDTVLEDFRLKKLEKIYLEELQEIKQCMQKEKRAAYQERMLSIYFQKYNCQYRQK